MIRYIQNVIASKRRFLQKGLVEVCMSKKNHSYGLQVSITIKIYKFSGILKLWGDLKSASNFEDFFYKIRFFYNSLSKSGNAI